MKFERNKKYNIIAAYALVVILIAMACYQLMGHIGGLLTFLGNIARYLSPIIYSVVFAFLLNPILKGFETKLLPRMLPKWKAKRVTMRAISIILTYIVAVIAIYAFFSVVLPQLVASVMGFWKHIPHYLEAMNIWYININDYLYQLSMDEGNILAGIMQNIAAYLVAVITTLLNQTGAMMGEWVETLIRVATSFTIGLVNMVLGLIISIYVLLDKEKLLAQLNKTTAAIFPNRAYLLICDIAKDINRICTGFVTGKIIESIIVAILCLIGMTVLKMPYIALVTTIVGVTNVIPYFGSIFGGIIGSIIIFIDDPIKGLIFAVFILLLQQLDGNYIGPKILGDTIGLSPLMIITSIMLFGGAFGLLGMFIGVPLFAILYSMARRLVIFLLARKGYPTSTKDYATEKNPLLR